MKILLVGDNDNSDVLKDIRECTLIAVKEGYSAVEIAEREKPDYVLLRTPMYIDTVGQLDLIDQLTGLANRPAFEKQAAREWDRVIREKKVISALMIDVDYFEEYNTYNGRLEGDNLLRTAAGILASCLKRPSDYIARWGGDCFVVLLPGAYTEGAKELAEQIRAQIEALNIAGGGGHNVTVSIGVNSAAPHVGAPLSPFLSGTEKALHTAKEAGKNRISD